MKSIKGQVPNIELTSNDTNYIYDKYFNDEDLLNSLLDKESTKLVSDLKSSYVVPYDIEEERNLKKDRTRWHKLQKS